MTDADQPQPRTADTEPTDGSLTEARQAARRRMLRRRRRTATVAVATLVLASLGYTVTVAAAPLPALQASLTVAPETEFVADPQGAESAVATQALPSAIGWADGESVWANSTDPYPIASITKLFTVLVGQEAAPLTADDDGFTYAWTAADRQRQSELVALSGIAFPVPVGSEFTQRQMLELILLPSANDFAQAYAYAIFGDNDGFVAAVNDWTARHGLTSVTVVEPSGMDSRNQASPADLVRVARQVLADPVLSAITRTQSAEIPGIGEVTSTNPLLGTDPGVVGLKTGRLFDSGFNLVAAQTARVGERELVKIAVTLGRPTAAERAGSSRDLLARLEATQQTVDVLAAGETAGTLLTWAGETVPVVTEASSTVVLVPGERAVRALEVAAVTAPDGGVAPAGTRVGEWIVDAPTGGQRVGVVTTADIAEPDLWWRLTHPAIVFGWADPRPTD